MYLRNRLARIYPLYVLAILAEMVMRHLGGQFWQGQLDAVTWQLSGLQAWYPGMVWRGNVPAWSISAELFFYLLFPILLRVTRSLSPGTLASIGFAAWLLELTVAWHVHLQSLPEWQAFIKFAPIVRLPEFARFRAGARRELDVVCGFAIDRVQGASESEMA